MLWTTFADYLDVNRVMFTIMGYPMSYIEFFGTLFNLWSVWLIAKQRIATWPVGIVGVLLFLILFYQIQLYSDTLEQVYYLIISVYGWWRWSTAQQSVSTRALPIRFSRPSTLGLGIGITVVLSLLLGLLISRIHVLLPALFPEPASYPFLDALTTMMSFTAMFLMAQKRIESWAYWIAVDIIGIGLYYAKDVAFIALLYVVFLVLAVNGLRMWLREARQPILVPASHAG